MEVNFFKERKNVEWMGKNYFLDAPAETCCKEKEKLSEVRTFMEENYIPIVEIFSEKDGEIGSYSTSKLFNGRRCILFSVIGAFKSSCNQIVLDYESKYDELISNDIDEVYCISVNDSWVMDAWRESLNIQKVKFIADGNNFFTNAIGMSLTKYPYGAGERSHRYSAVIKDGQIEWTSTEYEKKDNMEEDVYLDTKPEVVLEYLKSNTTN